VKQVIQTLVNQVKSMEAQIHYFGKAYKEALSKVSQTSSVSTNSTESHNILLTTNSSQDSPLFSGKEESSEGDEQTAHFKQLSPEITTSPQFKKEEI
jgi:hypothetical protein